MGRDKFRQECSDWWPSLVLFDVFLIKSHWRNSSPQTSKTPEMQMYFREDVLNLSVFFFKKTSTSTWVSPKGPRGSFVTEAPLKGLGCLSMIRRDLISQRQRLLVFSKISWGKEYTHAKTNMETSKIQDFKMTFLYSVEFENVSFDLD